ncbi:MAG: T9SS type A sorting domain-containing protein [Crocinitomicaceae bacterium]|jgi:plastocyanin|nr:T9SS type A sorting domain-containing protein [Crocinitomicaceae bacterium]
MKTILLLITLSTSVISYGQNPSMTIAHTGISPNSELTVYAGESIDFLYGSGGNHPMTEGWQSGAASTPIPFVTQTVNSSIQSVTFTLDIPGTYYFHCGTNPGNSNNWGQINVLDSTSTGITEKQPLSYNVYPNPVSDILTIENFIEEAYIYNIKGEKVFTIQNKSTDISTFPSGVYFVESNELKIKFIKL